MQRKSMQRKSMAADPYQRIHISGSAVPAPPGTFLQINFRNAIAKGEAMTIAETDEQYHDVIYQGTGNDKLVQMLNNLREQMYRYRLEYIKDEDKRQVLLVEHEHILKALRNRNIADAKNAAREHIDNQEITVSRNIKEQDTAVLGRGRK